MTIANQTRVIREAGNGSKTAFDFAFKIYNASDLKVYKIVNSTEVRTLATITTDYTVSISTSAEGGTVTYVVAPTALQDSFIESEVPYTQATDIPTVGGVREEQIENSLDKLCILVLQLLKKAQLALKFASSSTQSDVTLPEPVIGKLPGWGQSVATTMENYDNPVVSAAAAAVSAAAALASQTAASASQTAAGVSAAAAAASAIAAATYTTSSVNFIMDGGGSALTVGVKGDIRFPFACTITKVSVLADQTGSIVLDLWKDTYANYPPTGADTITASAKPTLSSAVKAEDSTLTGWTKPIAAGSTLRINVDSITTIQRATLVIEYQRT